MHQVAGACEDVARAGQSWQAWGVIVTLETERLVMRPFVAGDLGALTALHAEASFYWYPLRRAMTPEETAAHLEDLLRRYEVPGEPAMLAVLERSSGELAGWGGLSVPHFLPEVMPAVEVGWRLGTSFRGRGYATELGAAALEWGFTDLGLERIVSIFEPENKASGRVMDRLGFDPGYETIHPARSLPIVVRTLALEDWRSGSAERTEAAEAAARTERTETAGRAARTARAERTERTERTGRAGRAGRTARADP